MENVKSLSGKFTENNIQKIQSWKHHKYIENTYRSPED
jgi:hypothetical protein